MTTYKQKGFLYSFAVRWFVCTLGLWIASGIFTQAISHEGGALSLILAGAVLAAVNTVIKPILVVISMPALLVTLGLFMLVVNALTVLLAATLYGPLAVNDFWTAVGTGIIIGLVNYLVTAILEER